MIVALLAIVYNLSDPMGLWNQSASLSISLPDGGEVAHDESYGGFQIGAELLYLVGVEGTSHHGVYPILNSMGWDRCRRPGASCGKINSRMCPFYPDVKGAYNVHQNIFAARRTTPTVFNVQGVKKEVARVKGIVRSDNLEFLSLQGKVDSFPAFFLDNPRKRKPPWPIDLLHLHEVFSGTLTLRLIILLRPFQTTVWSHWEHDGGTWQHAELMSAHLIKLGSDLGKLPLNNWRILPVDCMYQDKETRLLTVSRLADYLRWRPEGSEGECLNYYLRDWKGRSKKTIPDLDLKKIIEVEKRDESKWGVFRAANYTNFQNQYLVHPELCV